MSVFNAPPVKIDSKVLYNLAIGFSVKKKKKVLHRFRAIA